MAVTILVFHVFKIWPSSSNLQLSVEFFFFVSGFLLTNHIERKPDESIEQLVKGKVASIYPYLFVSVTFACVALAWVKGENFFVVVYRNLHQFMLLTIYFIGTKDVNWSDGATAQLWFIMAQLWAFPTQRLGSIYGVVKKDVH